MAEIKIREVTCKTALSPCGLPGFKYSLNPYRGCQHGCLYCYSPSIVRESRTWGSFVDVKINIPTILSKELARKESGIVWLGSVCDAYQPIEGRYGITHLCLEQLRKVDMPVSLLTKSDLVTRDYELIDSFSDFELGFSMAYADDSIRECLEPGSPPLAARMKAIAKAAERGLNPWVFIAPIMPGFTDRPDEIPTLVRKLSRAGVERIGFDPFHPRPRIWPRMREIFEADPDLRQTYRTLARNPEYYSQIAEVIERECRKNGITLVA